VNSLQAGFGVSVYDVREAPVKDLLELGANPATSPKEVAKNSEFICVVVWDDSQVQQVMAGPALPLLFGTLTNGSPPKIARSTSSS
jgi:3-hydroxyisobutyrate dehydrogenase-like beta-hydroxyacid dehydrogenase